MAITLRKAARLTTQAVIATTRVKAMTTAETRAATPVEATHRERAVIPREIAAAMAAVEITAIQAMAQLSLEQIRAQVITVRGHKGKVEARWKELF